MNSGISCAHAHENRRMNRYFRSPAGVLASESEVVNGIQGFLRLAAIIIQNHPDEWEKALTNWQLGRLEVIRLLYEQQRKMYENHTNRIDNRIVSLSQPWVRPIVRGKQNAEVEFGAKVELSDVDGFLRIEDFRWDAFNESTTLTTSVEAYRKAYGHYPARVLADTIFRTRENVR